MFEDTSDELREDNYCDKCDLCVRNSLIPSRGQGLEGSGTILHLVAAPSPADRKTKYVLSGNTVNLLDVFLKIRNYLLYHILLLLSNVVHLRLLMRKLLLNVFLDFKREIARVEPSMFITYGKDPYFIVSGGKSFS